jgi:hypothetical protein
LTETAIGEIRSGRHNFSICYGPIRLFAQRAGIGLRDQFATRTGKPTQAGK